MAKMIRIGEVCLLTRDVPRLAGFYRALLDAPAGDDREDLNHQFVLTEETSLTVMRDDRRQAGQSAVLAFTVGDMDAALEKVLGLGAEVVERPTARPWGAVSMSFRDPDGNAVYFRSFPKTS